MSLYFRAPEIQPAGELPGAGLSAGVEHHMASPAEVTQAHNFFQPDMKGALSISTITPGAETAALIPGADSAAMGALTPGAEQISPMIQMIMKLPGIGGITSFFEALAALFMPGADALSVFDLSQIGAHAQGAVASLSTGITDHLPISLSLLPANAPILQGLGLGAGQGMHGLTYLPGKLGASLSDHGLGTLSRDSLNVSGQLDINKPQFEMGGLDKGSKLAGMPGAGRGPLTSGAHMSDAPVGNHLAGSQRLFSDQTSLASTGSPLAATNMSSNVGLSQSVPLSGQSWPSSMQAGASNFGTDVNIGANADAAAQSMRQMGDSALSGPNLSQNVGHHIGAPGRAALDGGQQLGPSGAVSEQLGGRQLLASEGIPTYRPTFGDSASGSFNSSTLTPSSTPAAHAGSHATGGADAGSAIKGLKAKQLSLKTPSSLSKPSIPQHKPVMDHIGHQTKVHGSHPVGKGGDVMDQTAHAKINKVGTHGDHKVSHAPQVKHVAPKAVDAAPAHGLPTDQQIAQADITKGAGTDAVAPGSDASTGTYTIRSGDNLWNIARDHLGSGSRWTEIYKMNSDVLGSNPSLIHGGTTIRLPGAGTEIASAGAEAGKYVVQPGDNLWDIASEKLGGGQHWGEIYKANSNVIGSDPRLIVPGQELNLGGQPSMQVASQAPAVQPAIAQQAPIQPSAPAAPVAQPSVEVAQPNTVADTAAPPATYEQMPTPQAHPVMPASHVEPSGLPPAEAAAPPAVRPTTTSFKTAGSSIVSSSLRPDLSFLSKRPGK